MGQRPGDESQGRANRHPSRQGTGEGEIGRGGMRERQHLSALTKESERHTQNFLKT